MPIYDQGYRRYEARGPLHQIRFWPITREALRLILAKRAFLLLLALAAPALALAGEGADVYKSKCAACHGADGKGSPMGEKLGVKSLVGTQADVVKVVTEGKPPKMTPYKDKLTAVQIKAVADHVKSLK